MAAYGILRPASLMGPQSNLPNIKIYKVCNLCHFLLKANEDAVRHCPIASAGALNDSAIFHGSSSIAQNSPVPSRSASNGQPFTVIAALPSTGME